MAVRKIHCEGCKAVRDFRQFRVQRKKTDPGLRRRWFECSHCKAVLRLIEAREGWSMPPATLFDPESLKTAQ